MGDILTLIIVAFMLVCFVGWALNLQNLWEYWPVPLSQLWDGDSRRFLLSLIGVFVPPVGVVTGFVW